jgi:hypothetical protein
MCDIWGEKNEPGSLIDRLERSRHVNCTDSRDRIFALLNVSKDSPPLDIGPDYTATVADTYKAAARALVKGGKGHRAFCKLGCPTRCLKFPPGCLIGL